MFRDQHDDLLGIVTDISKGLNVASLSSDAAPARTLLSKLLGKLKMHLTMEDKSLYPRLMNSNDANLKAVAKKFSDEMGDIALVLADYQKNWPTAGAIQKDPASFIQQTNGIFAALGNRIERENNELYKLADEC
jgi:hypothetical protein